MQTLMSFVLDLLHLYALSFGIIMLLAYMIGWALERKLGVWMLLVMWCIGALNMIYIADTLGRPALISVTTLPASGLCAIAAYWLGYGLSYFKPIYTVVEN